MRRLLGVGAMLALTACDSSNLLSPQATMLGDPISEVADLSNDILIAPAAPTLAISYRDKSLTFSWQPQSDITTASLFAFNTTTETEELISDQISATATNHTQPFDPLQTAIDDWLYRIELCTAFDCVSSYRTAISTPLASPPQLTLTAAADDATWQPYLNRNGNVLVAVSKQAQSAEVHFKLGSGWTYASSLDPAGLSDSAGALVDVAMSDTGDTVAIAVYQPQSSNINISLFDRLGEGWFETSQWQTSYVTGNQRAPDNLIAMAGDADSLLVLAEHGLTHYSRDGFIYLEVSTETGDTRVLTWDASPDLSELAWLSHTPGGDMEFNRLRFRDNSYKHSMITNGMPLMFSIDANIQINSQGDEILIAGWRSENNQTSAVVWHAAIADDSVQVMSMQSATVTDQSFEQLVFGSSDDLQTSYLGWINNAQQHVQLYHMNKQSLTRSFKLHTAFSLAQQWYALAISGDGTRLSWASDLVYTLD